MKKSAIGAVLITAALGSQVLNAQVTKYGVMTFALTDTYQSKVLLNNVTSTNSVVGLVGCDAAVKYQTLTAKIDNKRVISAIAPVLGVTFTSKAQLVVVDYDNTIPAPPYPQYLVYLTSATDLDGPAATKNAPIVAGALLEDWPIDAQIDWVNYPLAPAGTVTTPNDAKDVTPKTQVFVYDSSNPVAARRAVEVSPFFSIEEAYCYFCWDTVDRVTVGSLTTDSQSDICIGPGGCSVKGSGTTKYYLTVKFNNNRTINSYINALSNGGTYLANLQTDGVMDATATDFNQVNAANWLQFSASGVVTYSWSIKAINSVATAMGTATMTQANGYANNPYCGTLTGSIKIVDTKVQ